MTGNLAGRRTTRRLVAEDKRADGDFLYAFAVDTFRSAS